MNKQTTWITAVLFAVMIMVSGCATKPIWLTKIPQDENYIYAVGDAQMDDESLAWKAATSRARQEFASVINESVEAMRIDYAKVTGKSVSDSVYSNISRGLSSAVLTGSEVVERYKGPGNMHHILAKYPRASMKAAASTIIQEEGTKNPDIDVAQALKAMADAFSLKRN
jgi:hypothetical protein